MANGNGFLSTNGSFTISDGTGACVVNAPKLMTQKRYMQLSKIAYEVIVFLQDKGVTPDEMCKVRTIAEQMQYLPKK